MSLGLRDLRTPESSAYEFIQGKSLLTTVSQTLQVATRIQGRTVWVKLTGEFEVTAGETLGEFLRLSELGSNSSPSDSPRLLPVSLSPHNLRKWAADFRTLSF